MTKVFPKYTPEHCKTERAIAICCCFREEIELYLFMLLNHYSYKGYCCFSEKFLFPCVLGVQGNQDLKSHLVTTTRSCTASLDDGFRYSWFSPLHAVTVLFWPEFNFMIDSTSCEISRQQSMTLIFNSIMNIINTVRLPLYIVSILWYNTQHPAL